MTGAELLFATTNAGKVREIRRLLEGVPQRLLFLPDFPAVPEVEENGETFLDNARAKALGYAHLLPGGFIAAEDSGLVVPSLGGEPGVLSARYGGLKDDTSRNALLLERMRGLEGQARNAFYEAVVVLLCPDGSEEVFTGRVNGSIAPQPDGTGGFGYDPLFVHPDLGRTFGNASQYEKDLLSHRGRALRALREYLEGASKG